MLKIIIYIMSFIGLVSCWSDSDYMTDRIAGTYAFEFPSGEYQLLKINTDSTFTQKYYINYHSYKKGKKAIYFNKGKWSKTNSKNEISLQLWLKYCKQRDPDSILPNPEHVGMNNVLWFKGTSREKDIVSISSIYDYNFERIDLVKEKNGNVR